MIHTGYRTTKEVATFISDSSELVAQWSVAAYAFNLMLQGDANGINFRFNASLFHDLIK
ncbi:hypothetical protein CES85_5271 [Ochrobactrum quorumnocens]|uniref:Uncharacterized protein n=1 Tax=Ochrobactrum quorumnocens TaxID=271865 RepID=A0A248UCD4_9HYPH|nr:hypothetical protein CES85_5271 [[Ochrobactrum] quorumnocens]